MNLDSAPAFFDVLDGLAALRARNPAAPAPAMLKGVHDCAAVVFADSVGFQADRGWSADITATAVRLADAARRIDPAAVAATLADGPRLEVVLLPMAAGPQAAARTNRAADAWTSGLVPPHRVWIATDAGPRLHGRAGPPGGEPVPRAPAGRPAARHASALARLRETVGLCDSSHVVLAESAALPNPCSKPAGCGRSSGGSRSLFSLMGG
jgi:hypothetical protein